MGTKEVLNVASVERKFAQPKLCMRVRACGGEGRGGELRWVECGYTEMVDEYLIPVVTATWPRRLNQPVTHEANAASSGRESIAAQK